MKALLNTTTVMLALTRYFKNLSTLIIWNSFRHAECKLNIFVESSSCNVFQKNIYRMIFAETELAFYFNELTYTSAILHHRELFSPVIVSIALPRHFINMSTSTEAFTIWNTFCYKTLSRRFCQRSLLNVFVSNILSYRNSCRGLVNFFYCFHYLYEHSATLYKRSSTVSRS